MNISSKPLPSFETSRRQGEFWIHIGNLTRLLSEFQFYLQSLVLVLRVGSKHNQLSCCCLVAKLCPTLCDSMDCSP